MGVAVGFALTAGLTSQTVTFAMILVASGASENRGVVPPDRISARFVAESVHVRSVPVQRSAVGISVVSSLSNRVKPGDGTDD
jgi:hypothetical protein